MRKSTPLTTSLNQTTARILENRGISRPRALETQAGLSPPLWLEPVSAIITGRGLSRVSVS